MPTAACSPHYRKWFLWSDTNPGTSGSNGPSWHTGKFGYYYAVFGDNMPDFNYTNPDVTAFMEKVARFWLTSVGVDGFRLDAVKYLIEEGQKLENTRSTHFWLQGFYSAYKTDKPDAFTVGEVFGADAILMKTYAPDQVDEVFNFELASGMVNSAAGEANSGVNSALTFMLENIPDGQFATFLTNHDQNRVMSVLNGNLNRGKSRRCHALHRAGYAIYILRGRNRHAGQKAGREHPPAHAVVCTDQRRIQYRDPLASPGFGLSKGQRNLRRKQSKLIVELLPGIDLFTIQTLRPARRHFIHGDQ